MSHDSYSHDANGFRISKEGMILGPTHKQDKCKCGHTKAKHKGTTVKWGPGPFDERHFKGTCLDKKCDCRSFRR